MNVFIAIICITVGIFVIYLRYRSPPSDFSEGNISSEISAYGSGLLLIVIGIALIIKWFEAIST